MQDLPINFVVTTTELNTILEGLGQLQYNRAQPIISALVQQGNAQVDIHRQAAAAFPPLDLPIAEGGLPLGEGDEL